LTPDTKQSSTHVPSGFSELVPKAEKRISSSVTPGTPVMSTFSPSEPLVSVPPWVVEVPPASGSSSSEFPQAAAASARTTTTHSSSRRGRTAERRFCNLVTTVTR
jgi:hypothetical protein